MVRLADIARRAAICGSLATTSACAAGRSAQARQPRGSHENSQGTLKFERGELSAAQRSFFLALSNARAIDDSNGRAIALLNLSRIDSARGHHERALWRAQLATTLSVDNPRLHGAALARRATTRSQRGEHVRAVADARTALIQVPTYSLPRGQTRRLQGDRATTLASALVRAGGGHCREAEAVLQRARDRYGRRIRPDAEAAIAHLRGQLALGHNWPKAATPWFARALALDRTRGRPLDVADDLESLATCAERSGDPRAAAAWLSRALAVRASIDTPQRTLATATRLAALQGADPPRDGGQAALRAEVGDAVARPPTAAMPCDGSGDVQLADHPLHSRRDGERAQPRRPDRQPNNHDPQR